MVSTYRPSFVWNSLVVITRAGNICGTEVNCQPAVSGAPCFAATEKGPAEECREVQVLVNARTFNSSDTCSRMLYLYVSGYGTAWGPLCDSAWLRNSIA